MTAKPTILRYPRGTSQLEIRIGANAVEVTLWGPREHQIHPQLAFATAEIAEVHLSRTTYPGNPLPYFLWLHTTLFCLSEAEAEQVGNAITEHTQQVAA